MVCKLNECVKPVSISVGYDSNVRTKRILNPVFGTSEFLEQLLIN